MKRSPMPPRKQSIKRKAKRMKAVSPKRAEKRKVARERYQDGFGVYFDEVPLLLGPVANWPKVRIVDSPNTRWEFIERLRCAWCLDANADEAHHIIGGSRGRCDSLTNLFPICRDCHSKIQSNIELQREVLLRRWRFGRETVSWVRLTLLHGRFFDFDTLA